MFESVELPSLLLLILLGIGMLWVAVPMGLTMGVPPWLVAALVIPASIAGAALMIWLVSPLREFVRKRYPERNRRGRTRLIFRVWRRSGLPGLGILGPLLVGPPPTMALGVILGASAKRLLLWTSLGIIVWTSFMELLWLFGHDWFVQFLG